MTDPIAEVVRKRWPLRVWVRAGFVLWAVFVMSWLANSVRTRGVDESTLRSNGEVSVLDDAYALTFVPTSSSEHAALIFMCGSGISAEAYAPLLRPVAEAGFRVTIVRLPYRFAPLESHKEGALGRVRAVITANPEVKHWVIGGHSLGGALAARLARVASTSISGLVLVGTTHPKDDDLSFLRIPVTKIFASNDGIAPPDRVHASRRLLPPQTKWVEIAGGNHSQFGRYGHQLFDGAATTSREEQEALTRSAILQVLVGVGESQ